MRLRVTSVFLASVVAAALLPGCRDDTPSIVRACLADSEAKAVEAWRDRAILMPRTSSKDLVSSALWQGIKPTMSRSEIESLLVSHLRSRQPYWSEFETPLGRLRWSLDREASGGDVVQIPRIYLYPKNLSLKEVFSAEVVECLRRAAPEAKYVVVRRSSGRSQPTTLVVDGFRIQQVIWRQTKV